VEEIHKMPIEIYDCTLREGEQAKSSGFDSEGRKKLAMLLDELGVDFIELPWPTNSELSQAYREIMPLMKNSKIVAFGSTARTEDPSEDPGLKAIVDTGVKYACIFGKADIDHVDKQLRISGDANLDKIEKSVKFLKDQGLTVFFDAEHFFDGYKRNQDYALDVLTRAAKGGAERLVLCDTNGGLMPHQATPILQNTTKVLEDRLDDSNIKDLIGVHLHDDCDNAIANAQVMLPFIHTIQGTINGLGERVGNLNFTTFLGNYLDKLGGVLPKINLERLTATYRQSCYLSGIQENDTQPYAGRYAFAHAGGVHINAIARGASYEHTDPRKFGNQRVFVLNQLAGSSGIIEIAKQHNLQLSRNSQGFDEKAAKLFEELKCLEAKGYDLGAIPAEQYLLLKKHFSNSKPPFRIKITRINTETDLQENEHSTFYALCEFPDKTEKEAKFSVEGGPIDAAFNALKAMLREQYPQVDNLHLANYDAHIARFSEEHSQMRTEVLFRNGQSFSTAGVDQNILYSGVKALAKAFQYHLLKNPQI